MNLRFRCDGGDRTSQAEASAAAALVAIAAGTTRQQRRAGQARRDPTDANDVRKPTDAGEHPLMDPYIRRVAHRNLFASHGTVD